jgi:von Willebrand factor A domain-containing protein 7
MDLKQREARQARRYIGEALHVIQDFYSHSTWVEGGRTTPESNLGKTILANPNQMPCTMDSEKVDTPSALSTAYYQGRSGCQDLIKPDPLPAGKCYHGNYNFSRLGQKPCVGINKDLTQTDVDLFNKEGRGLTLHPLHATALATATVASKEFVELVLDDLKGDDLAILAVLGHLNSMAFVIDGTGSMVSELPGVRTAAERMIERLQERSEAHVVDYTLVQFGDFETSGGLTTTDPNQLIESLDAVRAFGGGDLPEATNLGILKAMELVTDGASLYVFTNSEPNDPELEAEVTAEAERRQIALFFAETKLAAIEGFGQAETLAERAHRLARTRGARVQVEAAAVPPTGTPAYARMAEATGGQAFLLPSSGMAAFADLVLPEPVEESLVDAAYSAETTLLSVRKGLISPIRAAKVPLLVDLSVTSLLVSVTATTNGDAILRTPAPARRTVTADSSGVTVTPLVSGKVYRVDNPERGEWEIEVKGSGEFSVIARVISPVQFSEFGFVRATEDVHGGFFPIRGEPVAVASGEPEARGNARVRGAISDPVFTLEGEDGSVVGQLSLEQGLAGVPVGSHHGVIPVPSVPFRVVVSGRVPPGEDGDTRGVAFRRVSPRLYRARTVGVQTIGDLLVRAAPGEARNIDYLIRNHGPAGDFIVSAKTVSGAPVRVLSAPVRIAQGATATVRIGVTLGADMQEGEVDTLQVIVKQAGNDSMALTSNSTSTDLGAF